MAHRSASQNDGAKKKDASPLRPTPFDGYCAKGKGTRRRLQLLLREDGDAKSGTP